MMKWILACVCVLGFLGLTAQPAQVYVDDSGVLRWSGSKKELYGFGINYTAPFAHAYRSAEKLGVDLKSEIDRDIYHFARLGFDAYRVHVWDTEISDSLGNLLDNEHLQLFDYMLAEMQKHGMRMLITPIAFWGNGWPEPDTWSPGFSHKYGKGGCLVIEEAIKAQENYLFQLLNHVNPYTGLAYKNDPSIVAFEVSNEPHHRQPADSVKLYVSRMVGSMRKTGCQKPIFYNFSHSIQMVEAYIDGGAQGGTFQWYPTGLGAGEEIGGNLLVNVDRYEIPFAANDKFRHVAKVVYEFDAADVGRSYIYPAMARSFRTAGMQWATHFAYDPTFLAYANTEYNTHYMNLAYTPQKALSLAIASKVFHEMPRYTDYGAYPANTSFGHVNISYEKDLAEYNAELEWIYTNHTTALPVNAKKLQHIAGWGNSALVHYDGTGAYFLDKVGKDVWRLEVMPDAIWVHDPFGSKNSLNRKLTEIIWQSRNMELALPDLGEQFVVEPLNEGNHYLPVVSGKKFSIEPGTYLVKSQSAKMTLPEKLGSLPLRGFAGPAATIDQTYVLHTPIPTAEVGSDLTITIEVAAPYQPEEIKLLAYMGWDGKEIVFTKVHGFTYQATLPGEYLHAGMLRYYILLKNEGKVICYPDGAATHPYDWDFAAEAYEVPVLPKEAPLYLYNARTDDEKVSRGWVPGSGMMPGSKPGDGELELKILKLFEVDAENPEAAPIYDYTMRYAFGDKVKSHGLTLQQADTLVISGRSLSDKPVVVQVALISSDAMAYGAEVTLLPASKEVSVALKDLKPVSIVTMPRPYPSFLPYYFERAGDSPFDIMKTESLQISIGPGLSAAEQHESQAVGLKAVWLK